MNKTPEKIKNLFNKIAKNYDKLNDIISFGMQKFIKYNCIKLLDKNKNSTLLDLCTGTGDLITIAKIENSIGVDFSENMLEEAKKKHPKYKFIQADCTELPFENNIFDIITISYGLRNIENREKALKEIYRVLRPNGQFLHLDFGNNNIIRRIFEKIVPTLVKLLNADDDAYKYLIQSIKDFPEPQNLKKEVENQGFKLKTQRFFIFKSICCQIYTK